MKQLTLPGILYPAIDHTTERSAARFFSTRCFRLPAPIVENHFSVYYLLYWRGSHLYDMIDSGTILHNGTIYQVVYKHGLTRGKILARLQDQYALSFRQPQSRLDLPAVVMISETINRNGAV
jgi:hypothetical protein